MLGFAARPVCVLLCGAASLFSTSVAAAENWSQFRGPFGSGVAGKPVPVHWNVNTGQNVRWSVPIPGLGLSSPIVHGDRIYVTSAISGIKNPELKVGLYGEIEPVKDDTEHRFMLYAIDRASGKIVWEAETTRGVPKIQRHTKASHANSTPVTDGKTVLAFFGSEGLYAYDIDGTLRWKKNFGVLDSGFFRVPDAQWGFGSSPVIFKDRVIVQVDVQSDSFVAALDLSSGKELWRTPRTEVPTWSTPTVVPRGDGDQLILNGWKHIGGYDPDSGKELWKMTGTGDIPVPTPVYSDGLIYLTSAHGPGSPIYAVRENAEGDITLSEGATSNESIVWSKARGGAYMQTPLVFNGLLFVCRDNGIVSSYDAKTGQRHAQKRLGSGGSGFTGSGILAGGRLYYPSEVGEIFVLEANAEMTEIADNSVDEIVMATPAAADGTLYIRGKDHLFAIEKTLEKKVAAE